MSHQSKQCKQTFSGGAEASVTNPRKKKTSRLETLFSSPLNLQLFFPVSIQVSVCLTIADMSMDLDAPVPIAADQQPVAAT